MSANITLPPYAAMVLAGIPTEQMGRHQFNSYLHQLFKCEGENTVTADSVYEEDDFYVEVFKNTPDGPMVAIHNASSQLVEIYRYSTGTIQDAA